MFPMNNSPPKICTRTTIHSQSKFYEFFLGFVLINNVVISVARERAEKKKKVPRPIIDHPFPVQDPPCE
jgi:hypothetical protein